ncbi:MAG: M48 family metallopeptidase [Bacteroidales bacterium]|nr:M48 family metallopeptidase [Bacteroidales bacterium]
MNVNGIDIQVERKPIKNIHLAVYPPDGRVHISAPEGYSDAQVRSYAMRKMAWIMEKQEVATSFERQSEREYVSGEAHYYFGALYRLKVVRTNTALQHVERNGDYLEVFVRENAKPEHIQNVLFEWYRAELKPHIENFIEKWRHNLGVSPESWEIRLMTSKWGSCTPKTKRLLFNLELAKKDLLCIEYIVVHEMAHLIERTHSDKFKLILDRNFPKWENIQKQLNEYHI